MKVFTLRSIYILAFVAAIVSIIVKLVSRTIWAHGFDLNNCRGCQAKIDWTLETAKSVSDDLIAQFDQDGVVLLSNFVSAAKVKELSQEIEQLPNTFLTDVIARFTLPHYLRYEHRIDSRSELVRDWAVHGPL